MATTLGSQAKAVAGAAGAPLLALAPGLAAVVAWLALRRPLRKARRRRRTVVWLALAAGTLLALATLAVGPLEAHSGGDDILVPAGWWDADATVLLAERVPEALRAALLLATTPPAAQSPTVRVLLGGFAAALAGMVGAALSGRRGRRIAADLAGGIVLVAVAAALGVYAAFAVIWLTAYLNFWMFAVLLIALQRWRHGAI